MKKENEKMSNLLLGDRKAFIISQTETERSSDYEQSNIDLINKYTQKSMAEKDLNVKSMWLCNDIIDSYYSRFNAKTLRVLAEKVVGQSVLIGHNKNSLPIGRFFKAEVVKREDGHEWLRTWFYWPKNLTFVDGFTSEDLLIGIESGLYMEVSISWSYQKALCSVCNGDIRSCDHIPGKEYAIDGVVKLCWYETDDIETVLEGSFVFKGGQYGTSVAEESRNKLTQERNKIISKFATSGERSEYTCECLKCKHVVQTDSHCNAIKCPECGGDMRRKERPGPGRSFSNERDIFTFIKPLKPEKTATITNEYFDLSSFPKELKEKGEFFVEPKYDGIRVQIHRDGDKIVILTSGAKEIQDRLPRIVSELKECKEKKFIIDAELIKRRGHSRLSHDDVVKYLNSKDTEDFSLAIKVFDIMQAGDKSITGEELKERRSILEDTLTETQHVSLVRYTRVAGRQLLNAMQANASKEGCMVKDLSSTYSEPSKLWKWKRFAELDVEVMKSEETDGKTFVYECGFKDDGKLVSLGRTFTTDIEAKVGDILRVRIAYVNKQDNEYRWYEPSVLDRRPDKDEPDTLVTVEKLLKNKIEDPKRIVGSNDNSKEEKKGSPKEDRVKWTTAFINTLPNSSFAVVERAYQSKKCNDKNARHLPFKDKDGRVDIPHYKNALARLNQIKSVCEEESTSTLRSRAKVSLNRYQNVLKGKKFYTLLKTWEGKNLFHQLFLNDGRWFKLPITISKTMFCKPIDTVEYRRSREVEAGEYSTKPGGIIEFEGALLNGEYRFCKVRFGESSFLLAEKIGRGR